MFPPAFDDILYLLLIKKVCHPSFPFFPPSFIFIFISFFTALAFPWSGPSCGCHSDPAHFLCIAHFPRDSARCVLELSGSWCNVGKPGVQFNRHLEFCVQTRDKSFWDKLRDNHKFRYVSKLQPWLVTNKFWDKESVYWIASLLKLIANPHARSAPIQSWHPATRSDLLVTHRKLKRGREWRDQRQPGAISDEGTPKRTRTESGGLLDRADRLGIHSSARGCPQPGNDKPRFGKKALRFGKSVVCKLISGSEPFKPSFCAWPCSSSFVPCEIEEADRDVKFRCSRHLGLHLLGRTHIVFVVLQRWA